MSLFEKIKSSQIRPAKAWTKIRTLDMHTGGEPVRVIIDGFPKIQGKTILEKRRYVKSKFDNLRKALLFEPRGHADMYGVLPCDPERPDSDFGVLFIHNEGYSTMCGHATLAIAKLAVDQAWVPRTGDLTTVRIDAPCGLLTAYVTTKNDEVQFVEFENVPSFVVALDETIDVPGLGRIQYDLAYGGAFYAYVDVRQEALNGLTCSSNDYRALIEKGMMIKHAVMRQKSNVVHPFESDLSFLYGTIFIEPSSKVGIHSKNVCVFAEGEVDRSPTGSGVSGRAAIHHARGELNVGEKITIESIVESTMTVCVKQDASFGNFPAIIPLVGGSSHYTGQHEFLIDPSDPMSEGFILR